MSIFSFCQYVIYCILFLISLFQSNFIRFLYKDEINVANGDAGKHKPDHLETFSITGHNQ